LVGFCAGCGIIDIDRPGYSELPGRKIGADEPGEELEERVV